MKLLIVVDYQNDFVDGSLGFKKATLIEKNIIKKIEAYDNVVFTFDTHDEDYLNSTLEGKKLPVKHCVKGTAGWELYGNVKNYLPKAIKVFTKNTFPSLDLANFLKD